MRPLYALTAAWALRRQQLTAPGQRERGEGPVSTAIIIAGLAVLAVLVVTWAVTRAKGFMDTAPNPAAPTNP